MIPRAGFTAKFARSGAAIVLAAGLLSACTMIVSKSPIFDAADSDGSDNLLGTYAMVEGSGEYVVEREGQAGLRILGIDQESGAWKQVYYADGFAIPLGGGDYAVQVGCFAMYDKDKWSAIAAGRIQGYTIYALAIRDRRAHTFWLLQNANDVDAGILSRYGVVKPKAGSGMGDVDLLPAKMPPETAKAFFREVIADAMDKASGSPQPAEQKSFGPGAVKPDSDEAKALTVTSASQCRSIAEHTAPEREHQ